MNTKYVGMILYDFPMQSQEEILEYRNFRKSIIGKGYYQLQESVYIVNSDTKEHIETIEKEVSIIASSRASIRSLILTEEQFKRMKVLSGEMTLGETIVRKERKILEFWDVNSRKKA